MGEPPQDVSIDLVEQPPGAAIILRRLDSGVPDHVRPGTEPEAQIDGRTQTVGLGAANVGACLARSLLQSSRHGVAGFALVIGDGYGRFDFPGIVGVALLRLVGVVGNLPNPGPRAWENSNLQEFVGNGATGEAYNPAC